MTRLAVPTIALACLAMIPDAPPTSQPLVVEACSLRLTQFGRAADFQATSHFRVSTNASGEPTVAPAEPREEALLYLEPDSVTRCVSRWRLLPDSQCQLTVRFGTTGSSLTTWTLTLSDGGCGGLELRIPHTQSERQ